MSYRLRAFAPFILLVPLIFSGIAADFAGTNRNQVLVMRNGQIVRGNVTRVGDYYLVTMGRDNEIRVSADQVEFACGSVEEAYEIKRNAASPFRAAAQLELAEWCLRHDLRQQAADHLLHAMGIDPDNKQIEAMQLRWQSTLQLERPVPRPKAASVQPVRQVRKPLVQRLPDGAVEQFANKIQPLLMNSCGASTCHGNNAKSDFKLVRPMARRPLTRRLTERNLEAVLELVDRENPGDSPLLTTPRGPHADLPKGIFDSRESRPYQQLAAWVQKVAVPLPDADNVAQDNDVQPASFTADDGNSDRSRPSAGPTERDAPPSNELSATPDGETQPRLLEQASQPARPRSKPRDPFDPEIFNRRFFGPR